MLCKVVQGCERLWECCIKLCEVVGVICKVVECCVRLLGVMCKVV